MGEASAECGQGEALVNVRRVAEPPAGSVAAMLRRCDAGGLYGTRRNSAPIPKRPELFWRANTRLCHKLSQGVGKRDRKPYNQAAVWGLDPRFASHHRVPRGGGSPSHFCAQRPERGMRRL